MPSAKKLNRGDQKSSRVGGNAIAAAESAEKRAGGASHLHSKTDLEKMGRILYGRSDGVYLYVRIHGRNYFYVKQASGHYRRIPAANVADVEFRRRAKRTPSPGGSARRAKSRSRSPPRGRRPRSKSPVASRTLHSKADLERMGRVIYERSDGGYVYIRIHGRNYFYVKQASGQYRRIAASLVADTAFRRRAKKTPSGSSAKRSKSRSRSRSRGKVMAKKYRGKVPTLYKSK